MGGGSWHLEVSLEAQARKPWTLVYPPLHSRTGECIDTHRILHISTIQIQNLIRKSPRRGVQRGGPISIQTTLLLY